MPLQGFAELRCAGNSAIRKAQSGWFVSINAERRERVTLLARGIVCLLSAYSINDGKIYWINEV